MTSQRRVAVIGGGIAGLAAAHALVTGGDRTADDNPTTVVFERDDHFGGKLRTSSFAGHPAIDEGADAFLARLPWGTALAQSVGLGDDLTSPAARTAAVWWEQLHRIPDGLLLGMPTEVIALARSTLLSWPGKLRAATEPLRRRTSLEPDSLGQFVRARFGDEVHFRLVDPLVGSIYAADTDHFSLAAVPQIADLAGRGRSVLLTARRTPKVPPATGPIFSAPHGGMGALATATATAIERAGGSLRAHSPVHNVDRDGRGYRVNDEYFDAVILAAPAAHAARLLTSVAPAAVTTLASVATADVAMITIAVPSRDWPQRLAGMSGYLVPKPMQRLVTAASFGSQKWNHWAIPETVILRISLGRDGLAVLHLSDDQLLAAALEECGQHLGFDLQPTHTRISRWEAAFPQYRPHHAARIAAMEHALPAGIVLAGASFHGIGVPACIRSGEQAAKATRTMLHSVTQ
jgi:oxygen-dependent protoporphyrinogen oxidase